MFGVPKKNLVKLAVLIAGFAILEICFNNKTWSDALYKARFVQSWAFWGFISMLLISIEYYKYKLLNIVSIVFCVSFFHNFLQEITNTWDKWYMSEYTLLIWFILILIVNILFFFKGTKP